MKSTLRDMLQLLNEKYLESLIISDLKLEAILLYCLYQSIDSNQFTIK